MLNQTVGLSLFLVLVALLPIIGWCFSKVMDRIFDDNLTESWSIWHLGLLGIAGSLVIVGLNLGGYVLLQICGRVGAWVTGS